ncbi:hypothetical protein K504DRAFT_457417 [Pleomassaria siparia CBS 279.74]|uniref:DUF7730 domain-containing protein n=1 Tax=Pleomassaria siparia CBS 279.74 TaxID=1314801 RepID=A0A6G1KSE6_9PLEO|nr:hypothetical protein K504DRAFT_457417 [Pleomassaria siparia CBS 279.74]
MPPSKDGMPFITKDIAKAFFELDLSGNGPSITSKTPKPRDRNPPVAPPLPVTNEVKGNNRVTFLTLPVEIRLQIYNELLVSRFDRTQNPSWAVGNTDQKLVLLHMIQAPQYRTMEPGILQTCKQIYHEANTILYSQNVFAISEPKQLFRLIAQIGFVNFRLIKTLHIWVPSSAKLYPWLQVIYTLAVEASGLRCIELGWGADIEGTWERGLGDNVDFVRALGRIQGLEKLVIEGYYAKNWPAYLEEKMGVRVRAICGHCREKRESRKGDLNDEESEHEKFIREMNERELQTFRKYQRSKSRACCLAIRMVFALTPIALDSAPLSF